MIRVEEFLLRRKSDGQYLAPRSLHTPEPTHAIALLAAEVPQWLKIYGDGYEMVTLARAKEQSAK